MNANMKISDRKITKEMNIPIPIENVWEKWTTHEGLQTFFGEDNRIELYPGGAYEIYFLMDEPYGRRGSEECKILSYLPQKMLSFSWNVPPSIPEIRDSEYKTWVVIEFEKLDDYNTKLILTHLGWPDDSSWNPVFEYFDHAWVTVFDWLLKSIN